MTKTLAKTLAKQEAAGLKIDMIVVEYKGNKFAPVRATDLTGAHCPGKSPNFRRIICGFRGSDGAEHQGY